MRSPVELIKKKEIKKYKGLFQTETSMIKKNSLENEYQKIIGSFTRKRYEKIEAIIWMFSEIALEFYFKDGVSRARREIIMDDTWRQIYDYIGVPVIDVKDKLDLTIDNINSKKELKNLEKNSTCCITIQCYLYDKSDKLHYDYFDYLGEKNSKNQYEPDSDMDFIKFKNFLS